MINIRRYQHNDFEEICSWWREHGECPPLPGMMIEDGTIVMEHDGKPVMTLTILITLSNEIAYFEGYCAKPGIDKQLSNRCGKSLFEYGYEFLKLNGFKRAIIFTDKPALVERYKELGMDVNMKDLVSLGRVL
jgi:hypothetical protein